MDALQAGKKFAICVVLWMNPETLHYVNLLCEDTEATFLTDDVNQDAMDEAREIVNLLPVSLKLYTRKRWFRERVSGSFN